VCTVEAPTWKCYKIVERKNQREMLRFVINSACATSSLLSGMISKLKVGVS